MKKAFTLIELLLVISIIALLSSIVLTNLRDSKTKAESAVILSSINQIRNVAEIYRSNNNGYAGRPEQGNCSDNDRGFLGTPDAISLLNQILENTPNKVDYQAYCAVSADSWIISVQVHNGTIKSTAHSILNKFGLLANAQTNSKSFVVASNNNGIQVFNNTSSLILANNFIGSISSDHRTYSTKIPDNLYGEGTANND